jgi:hypothetical protein
MKKAFLVFAASSAAAIAVPAGAATIITPVGTTFTAATPYTFSFGQSSFTLTGTGDIFNPTAVSTGGTGQFNTIFGSPTSDFVNRGTVTFGAGDQYAAFAAPTTIRFSNSDNFIGLRATDNGQTFYGYAFTTDNVINSFAFESVAGAAITATTAIQSAVPEPATWAMMIFGFGMTGAAMRRRKSAVITRVSYAL